MNMSIYESLKPHMDRIYWVCSLVKLPRQGREKALAGSLEVFTKWSPLTPDLDGIQWILSVETIMQQVSIPLSMYY